MQFTLAALVLAAAVSANPIVTKPGSAGTASFGTSAIPLSADVLATLPSIEDLPIPDKVTVEPITYTGPGCPSGSLSGQLSSDFTSYALSFGSLRAKTPATSNVTNGTSCRATIGLRYPAGWQFAISGTSFSGNSHLDDGVSAYAKNEYKFRSGSWAWMQMQWDGPRDDEFDSSSSVPREKWVWSTCSGFERLTVDSKLWLDAGGSSYKGSVGPSEDDDKLREKLQLRWRQC